MIPDESTGIAGNQPFPQMVVLHGQVLADQGQGGRMLCEIAQQAAQRVLQVGMRSLRLYLRAIDASR